MIHQDDLKSFRIACDLAHELAKYCGASIAVFEAKRRPLATGTEGISYCNEKRIAIAFRFKQPQSEGGEWFKNPIPLKMVLETVAHEVAHLIHPNHGKDFWTLEKQLIDYVRRKYE